MANKIQIQSEVTIVVETCISCGTPFGIEENRRTQLLRNGDNFYCPNGHSQHYTNPIEDQLKKAKEAEAWWKEQAQTKGAEVVELRGTLRTTGAKLTRTEKRISKGICPCCKRQFINMQRHMDTKHPGYKGGDNG